MVVAVVGEHTRDLAPTALAVACLWPVAGDAPIFLREGRIAEFAARDQGAGEGIGWFAARRDDVADGRARGIEVEMFLAKNELCVVVA